MSRPLRIEYPNAWYHVMNRGLNRRLIFFDPEDHSLFLNTLGEACSLFNVGVSAYCLMPNHYHLLVHTPEGNLSRFMRHLNGVYTQRFNRRRKRDGPLFRGRFKGILVQEDSYLVQVVQYIHRNPIEAKLAASLDDFKWSSHRFFIRSKNRPGWLDAECVLRQFSSRKAMAVRLYEDFMQRDPDEEVSRFYSKKYWSPVLGNESFVERIKKKYMGSDKFLDTEIKERRLPRGRERVQRINREVCTLFKIPEHRLYESRRGEENISHKMALLLSRELSGLRLRELAEAYHVNSYRTVASCCYRFRIEIQSSRKLQRKYKKLKPICSQEKT